MRQYDNLDELNKDLQAYVEQDKNEESSIGTKYEPYFNRDTQKFVDAWVITVDGWPQ